MNSSDLIELAMIAFIMIGIGAAIWTGGARNPVSTGGLDRKLVAMGHQLNGVESKVGDIENRVEEIERDAATTEDIKRLEKQISVIAKVLPDLESRQRAASDQLADIRANSAARSATVEHIKTQVDRMMDVLVTKGMNK